MEKRKIRVSGHRPVVRKGRAVCFWNRGAYLGVRNLISRAQQEVMEKLFKANQPNISPSVPANRFLSLGSLWVDVCEHNHQDIGCRQILALLQGSESVQ